jgi:hypothetical protein
MHVFLVPFPEDLVFVAFGGLVTARPEAFGIACLIVGPKHGPRSAGPFWGTPHGFHSSPL